MSQLFVKIFTNRRYRGGHFFGKIHDDKKNFHIWNEFPDGTQQDFTRSQFTDERIFSVYKYKTKEDILFDERGRKNNIAEKYQKLKRGFLKNFNLLQNSS